MTRSAQTDGRCPTGDAYTKDRMFGSTPPYRIAMKASQQRDATPVACRNVAELNAYRAMLMWMFTT